MPPDPGNAARRYQRSRSTARIAAVLSVVVVLAACTAGASAPTAMPDAAPTERRTVAASPSPSEAPTPSPPPLHALPDGWEVVREGAAPPFDLVLDAGYLWSNYDTQTVTRVDPKTLEVLEPFTFGTKPGAFPPDVQTIAPGTGGVWVTLASQKAVALFDPTSGTELRRIELDGRPYSVLEEDGELWVADYESNLVFRVDLGDGGVIATISVPHVTDLAVGAGSVWATVHNGRAAEHEPIEGNGGRIARIDPATNDVTLIDVGPRPYFLAVGFGSVWTGNATGGSVSRIDMATNEATTIPIFQDGAFDIEVVGDSMWVVVGPQWGPECRLEDPRTSFFVRIDPASNAVERVAFPCPVGVTPSDTGAWVTGIGTGGWVTRLLEPSS